MFQNQRLVLFVGWKRMNSHDVGTTIPLPYHCAITIISQSVPCRHAFAYILPLPSGTATVNQMGSTLPWVQRLQASPRIYLMHREDVDARSHLSVVSGQSVPVTPAKNGFSCLVSRKGTAWINPHTFHSAWSEVGQSTAPCTHAIVIHKALPFSRRQKCLWWETGGLLEHTVWNK